MRTALSWPDKRSACAACLRSLVSDCFCHPQHSAAPGSAQCSVVLSDWILGYYVPWIFPVIFFQPIDCLVSTLPCGKELHSTQILDGEVPPFVCVKPVSVMFFHWNISTVLQCLCLHKLRKEKKNVNHFSEKNKVAHNEYVKCKSQIKADNWMSENLMLQFFPFL